LWMHRIEREWCPMLEQIRTGGKKEADKARKELRESLIGISPIFEDMPYFMSEEFTLVDCCLAPILWRLPELNIELPEKQVKPLLGYMARVFEREAFKASLNEREKEMRA
ncbi:MAG TPA: stringent starvation protein A, partial [Halomonas sp.]|nr:stringent starvation protein A [Halomonas sp.]